MDNEFDNFNLQLKDLKPVVREKALEIFKSMPENERRTQQTAMQKAIEQAEMWFMDNEG